MFSSNEYTLSQEYRKQREHEARQYRLISEARARWKQSHAAERSTVQRSTLLQAASRIIALFL